MSDDLFTIESPFEFTDDGYAAPILRDLNNIKDLGVAIKAMAFEQDFFKYCKTYVVGYNQYNVQIIKQDCIYGGIRDLSFSVDAAKLIFDISFYLKPTLLGDAQLTSVIKGCSQATDDLSLSTKGWSLDNPIDLPTYIKQGYSSSLDFIAYIKTFIPAQAAVGAILKGWARGNSVLLGEAIKVFATAQDFLPAYIKSNFSDTLDLKLDIFKIWHPVETDLPFSVGGWAETNLLEYIRAISYVNLPTIIRATYLYDLVATMTAVLPKNLSFALYGWAATDVNLSIAYAQSPYDMPASINPVPSVNLPAFLKAYLEIEVPKDLSISIQSYYRANLSAYINIIPHVDLGAILIPKFVAANLGAAIYPKVVYVRTLLTLSYLECLDLSAAVNPICFTTSYEDLLFRVYSMHSKNLNASVFGTDGSNIIDLSVIINSYDYYECNSVALSIYKEPTKYTSATLHYNGLKNVTEIDKLNLKISILKSDVLFYTKDPGLTAVDTAVRYVEELEMLSKTDVDPYSVDLSSSVFSYTIGYSNYSTDSLAAVLLTEAQRAAVIDDSTTTGMAITALTYGTHYNTYYITLQKNEFLSGLRFSGGTAGRFYDYVAVYVRKFSNEAWTTAGSFYVGDSTSSFIDIDITFDTIESRYVKIEFASGSSSSLITYVYLIKLYSNVQTTTSGDLFKDHYYFTDNWGTPYYWTKYHTSTYITTPPVIRHNSLVFYHNNTSVTPPLALYAPDEWAAGIKLDYIEFYVYWNSSTTDQPAFRIYTSAGTTLLGVSFNSDCSIKHYFDHKWVTLSPAPVSGDNSWYRVRMDFDWTLECFTLTYEDTVAGTVYTFEELSFCEVGTTDIALPTNSMFSSNGTGAVLYDNAFGTLWYSGVGPGAYFGTKFGNAAILKQMRVYISNNVLYAPYNFEIRASEATDITDIYSGDVLYSSNEPYNNGFWSAPLSWKTFDLNNPNDIAYRSVWLVCYDAIELRLFEVEVFSKRTYSNNIGSFQVTLHNPNFDDAFWTGWVGNTCAFYLDDFHAQELTYKRVVNNNKKTNITASIIGDYLTSDLSAFVRAYRPLTYNASSMKQKLITLKLDHSNAEEWRRYVEVTFDNYVRSYYYFSGNQKAYREFVDDQWIVQVKGYSVDNLPAGVDRAKVIRKYLFNLKRYSSIDAAIKDMIDRVTAIKDSDLSCTIEGVPKKEANLSIYIESSVKRTYKSNRTLSATIIPIE